MVTGGWGGWDRTSVMTGSEPVALPAWLLPKNLAPGHISVRFPAVLQDLRSVTNLRDGLPLPFGRAQRGEDSFLASVYVPDQGTKVIWRCIPHFQTFHRADLG